MWVLLLRLFVACIRSMPPETQSRRYLSACGKLPGKLDQGPESLPRVDERGDKGRQVAKSCPPVLNGRVEN
jgi:hypothetical protein